LEDRALRWNSDLDGDLGTGASLALQASSLTTGTHTITLTAQDSQGQVGIDTLTIQVMRYRPSFPAILAVDSLSIDFTVELGSSEPMTYSMSIRNIGDGGMNWRATVDQPWISISAASGTTPIRSHPHGASKRLTTW